MMEVMRLIDSINDLNRFSDPIPSTQDLLISRVTVDDIKRFIKEIWG